MSDAGEPTKLGNGQSPTSDECSDLGNQASPTAPVTSSSPKNNPMEVDGSDPKTDIPAEPVTNGLTTSSNSTSAATGNQNRDAGLSTPPRCDSPRLRQLLSSPLEPKIQSSLVAPELQGMEGLKSEATAQEGADLQGTEARGGDVPEAVLIADDVPTSVQSTEAEGGDVPEAIAIAETVQSTEARTDSKDKIIPEVKSVKTTEVDEEIVPRAMQESESSKRDALDAVETASKAVKSTEDESVPEAVLSSKAEVSNIPEAKKVTAAEGDSVPEAMQGAGEAMQVAEVQEVNVLEAEKDIVAEDKISEGSEIGVSEAAKESVAEHVTENNVAEVVPDVKDGPPTKSKVISESATEEMQVEKEKEGNVPEQIQKQAAEVEMSEVSESSVIPQKAAAKHSDPAKSELASEAATEDMQTSEPAEADPSFKKPSASSKIQSMKGRLGDIKLEEPSVPESPKRRSARLQTLQRTHSESPSPKKERKSVRSLTLERTPSQEKMATRGQKGRLGSTSSNSEMEGSGDESKGKRVSRKDSKK